MSFQFDEKGWAHITPLGEFEHAGAGVVQVIDTEAAKAMVEDFKVKASADNFPGLLVDFDHFSMDTDKPSEAAGWICDLRHDSKGVWAQVRWTNKGKESVEGGVYRLVSPVFPKPSLCEDLGENRMRPREIVSVALTNEPNIKGAQPLTNRASAERDQSNRHDEGCAFADGPASECQCSCGGARHGDGSPDADNEPSKIRISSIRLSGQGRKNVSFTDEEGLSRYLSEGESEDGYEVESINAETGEAKIKTPSGETVTLKTDDHPKPEGGAGQPPGQPPGGPGAPGGPPAKIPGKAPPAKVDPKKRLTGVEKWMLGEAERKRKNDERKAAAKEKLKQIAAERRENRYKLKPLTPVTGPKGVTGTGKSFVSKPVIPKTRYYIDGAWYDGSGNFISRRKPANGLRNRSAMQALQVGTWPDQVRHPLPRLHLPCRQGQDHRRMEGDGQTPV
jgi:Mu-like prophage I protein